MREVTTIGSHSHIGSQGGEVCPRLVDVFLWQLLPGNFQPIICLGFGWSLVMVIFQHGATDVIVQRVQIWRVWEPLVLLNGASRLQPVLHDA